MFDGGLGCYKGSKVHIDLNPAVPLKHFKPYRIPNIHLETFKKELDNLVEIGVLEKAGMVADIHYPKERQSRLLGVKFEIP